MVAIVFPASSSPALRPQESAGRLINAFVEKTESGAPGQTLWRRSTGLHYEGAGLGGELASEHTRGFQEYVNQEDTGPNPTRAFWAVNNRLLMIRQSPEYPLVRFEVQDCGELAGDTPVTFACNNQFPHNQAVVVTYNECWIIATIAAEGPLIPPIPFADTDLPPKPTSVCMANGYFVWSYKDGKIYASELNSFEVNALSFNTEQDQLVLRVVWFAGRLYAFGNKWTGVYRDAGTQPFPFKREVTIPRGILTTHAVAGWEPGWANELIWVGDDCIVYKLNGYTPVPISTDAVTRAIEKAVVNSGREHIEAFVYMYGKNAFWTLSAYEATGVESNFTWEYNVTTGQWNERSSYIQGAHRNGWRGHRACRIDREWIVGDILNNNLYTIPEGHFTEGTPDAGFAGRTPHVWTVESGVMSGFPQRLVIPRASFNITTGVGRDEFVSAGPLPVPNPTVYISWSLDGGATWGVPVARSLGPSTPGRDDTRFYPSVICSGLSRGHGIRYRLRVEDDVHVGLSGGEIETQPRAP